jgi:hypothetical protein
MDLMQPSDACIWLQSTGLVRHVFRLLKDAKDNNRPVPWVLLENVRPVGQHMLRLSLDCMALVKQTLRATTEGPCAACCVTAGAKQRVSCILHRSLCLHQVEALLDRLGGLEPAIQRIAGEDPLYTSAATTCMFSLEGVIPMLPPCHDKSWTGTRTCIAVQTLLRHWGTSHGRTEWSAQQVVLPELRLLKICCSPCGDCARFRFTG